MPSIRRQDYAISLAVVLLLLCSGSWADSITGQVTQVGKAVTPRDVVVSYDASGGVLNFTFIDRALSLDEKQFVAVGQAGISSIKELGELSVPVTESGGRLTVGDGSLRMLGKVDGKRPASISVPSSTMRLSGNLKGAVQLQTKGQSSGTNWDLTCEGKVLDPKERRSKTFPDVKVGDSKVGVDAGWSSKGKGQISLGLSSRGRGHGQTLAEPQVVKQLVSALQQRAAFSHKFQGTERVNLSYQSGAYTLSLRTSEGPVTVVLDATASAGLAANLRAAAEYVGWRF